jgi:molybdate transport system permease protein
MPLDLSPLWISLKVAAIATLITVCLGLAAAHWMLGYKGRWKALLEGVMISPLVLPPTVVGFLLLWLLGKYGPVGQLFPSGFSVVFTWYAAVLTGIVVAFPLMYKTTLGAFEQIDPTLLQAARTLGASEFRVFRQITLPLALPGVLAGTTLAFARALGEFGASLMLAGNIPGQTQTISMAIYFALESGDTQAAWFWSLLILGISLSGLTAVNVWQTKMTSRKGGFQCKDGKGGFRLNSMVFRDGFRLNPPLRYSHSTFETRPIDPSLTVKIGKRLFGFSLDVSFTAKDQPLGVLGASGAGKSLLLRCIAGIETPDNGQIVLNGRILFDAQRRVNVPSCDRRIALLFQNYALFPHLSVAQNIAFGLPKEISGMTQQQQIAFHLSAVQLEGFAHYYPHQLSGGQQQRVALARALASQPEVLLLDEPLSALDTHLRQQIETQIITSLTAYPGVALFVTHNLEEVYRVCEDLLLLEGGKAISTAPKHHIFDHPQTASIARLTGCKNFSRASSKGTQSLEAIDWGCRLQVSDPVPHHLDQVGIRAHHIVFLAVAPEPSEGSSSSTNIFPCWLSTAREGPHRMSLFLKLHAPPDNPNDYHLQAEVFKEKWFWLKDLPLPWWIELDPQRLILMTDEPTPSP